MKLLIAIPALNEEDSIASIIERSLSARAAITAGSPVTEVEVTVVSDGSTDRTVEIARQYEGRIRLICFERNRGYGAAIKEAWSRSDADLLAFLDADGTCDPEFFSVLCARQASSGADIVVGCRLNRDSRMPVIRRIGNVLFALLLSALSYRRLRDTASGMRVVRRGCLPSLMPLPDGMHFTPAMSARAILSDELTIEEVDMPYRERAGTSKLSVVRDGLRFLRVIVEAALLFRPSRPLGAVGLVFGAASAGLMVMPSLYYLQHRYVLEWMIYRFVVASLAASSGCLLLCLAYLSMRLSAMVLSSHPDALSRRGLLPAFFRSRFFWAAPAVLTGVGVWLVVPSFLQLVHTGATYEHWSRFIVMSLFLSCALTLASTKAVDYTLDLIARQLAYLRGLGKEPAAPPVDERRAP